MQKDDLISRQAAIEVLRNRWLKTRNYEGIGEDIAEECEIYLKTLPSVQSERTKGKWTATYSDCGPDVWVEWKCSECGYVRKKGWEHTKDAKNPDALFCEMCGADMRGEQDE